MFSFNDIYLRWFGGDGLKIVGEVIQVPKVLGLAFGTQNRLMVAEGQDTFLKAHNRAWSCAAGQVSRVGLVGGQKDGQDSTGGEVGGKATGGNPSKYSQEGTARTEPGDYVLQFGADRSLWVKRGQQL